MTLVFSMLVMLTFVSAAQDGDDVQGLCAEARAKADVGKTAEAVELYRRAATLAPSEAAVLIELARLLARDVKTRAEAEKLYANAATLAPQDAGLAAARAANLAALGDPLNATLEYRRAFEIKPNDETAARGFVSQVVRLGAAPAQITNLSQKLAATPDDLASRLLLAEVLRADARYNDALKHYWLAARAAPDNTLALRGTAEAWLALGYFGHAEESFARAAAGQPESLALADRARVFSAAGQPEAAVRLLTAPSARIEKHQPALLALADAYHEVGWLRQERAALEASRARDSQEKIPTLERLVRVLYRIGDRPALRKASGELLAVDPSNAVGAMGMAKAKAETPSGAAAAPTTTPQTVTPTRAAGRDQEEAEAALFLGQPEMALPPLRRALAVRPDALRLKISLAVALLRTADGEAAAAAFRDVATYAGPRPDALLGLARAEMLRRQPARAHEAYNDVLRLDPTNFPALLGLSEVLQSAGDDERAAMLLTELARRAPDSKEVNLRLRERLLSIGRSYKIRPELALSKVGDPAGMAFAIEPLIGAGDSVRVRIAGQPLPAEEVSVDGNGLIRLAFLGEAVTARCLSERELGGEIARRGGARLAGSHVEVSLTAYKRTPLNVAGAVYLPGGFHVRTALDLRAGLMLASGTAPRAGRSIYVVRGACGAASGRATGISEVEVYARGAAEEGMVKLGRLLRAGDTVVVAGDQDVFIAGAVARPGVLKVREALTLRQAVAQSGGTSEKADRGRVSVWRLLPDGASYRQHQVSLPDIEGGRVGDVVLEPGDVVDVPAVGGERTLSFATLLERIARQPPPAPTPGSRRLTVADKP